MPENIQQKIEDLRQELHQHNFNYYSLDQPSISDFEFDLKLKELQELEKKHPEFYDNNSPTLRVGGDVTKNFPTVQHQFRMYSLDNSYDFDDLEDWEKRIIKTIDDPVEFVAELKYDGASISILYENGKMKEAVTRGDGFRGDEITPNVKTISDIPMQLYGDFPERFFMRGEIYLTRKNFDKINERREEEGLDLFMKYCLGKFENARFCRSEKTKTFCGFVSVYFPRNAGKNTLGGFKKNQSLGIPNFRASETLLVDARSKRFH